jgi:hypothetical protein
VVVLCSISDRHGPVMFGLRRCGSCSRLLRSVWPFLRPGVIPLLGRGVESTRLLLFGWAEVGCYSSALKAG